MAILGGDRAQESPGLMAIEIAQRETLQMVVSPHAKIVRDPLSHALGVIVRDVGGERAHQRDDDDHECGGGGNLHFAAAGEHRFQDVVQPRRKFVAADYIIQNDLERPGRGQAHSGLHHHGAQDKEKIGPVGTNQCSQQRDQLDDSRMRGISSTADCTATTASFAISSPGKNERWSGKIAPLNRLGITKDATCRF